LVARNVPPPTKATHDAAKKPEPAKTDAKAEAAKGPATTATPEKPATTDKAATDKAAPATAEKPAATTAVDKAATDKAAPATTGATTTDKAANGAPIPGNVTINHDSHFKVEFNTQSLPRPETIVVWELTLMSS
jgi:cell pole-organizing protein PopZ